MAKHPNFASYYISDRFSIRSRYEIDQELLDRGIDAEEIDAAWHSTLHPVKKTLRSWLATHKKISIEVLAILGLTIWLVLRVFHGVPDPNQILFDSVPDYPNATKINLDSADKRVLQSMDGSNEYKIYVSTDSEQQIKQYYIQYADKYMYTHNIDSRGTAGKDLWYVSISLYGSYTFLILFPTDRPNNFNTTILSNEVEKGTVIVLVKGPITNCCR